MKFVNFTVRDKQVAGAIALLLFCERFSIYHQGLAELINHLFRIANANDLGAWEQQGLAIEIIGRGEPVPAVILNDVNELIKSDLCCIVEFVTEIGIADMYGATTNQPSLFLKKALQVLKKNNIEFILPPEIFVSENIDIGWGQPWIQARYDLLNTFYDDLLQKHL